MAQIIDLAAERRRRAHERAEDIRAGECIMDYARQLSDVAVRGQKFLSEYEADNLLPCDVEPTS